MDESVSQPVDVEEEETASLPSATHMIYLANGERICVQLHYEENKWALCDSVVPISTLDELFFDFEAKQVDITSPRFTMTVGERTTQWTGFFGVAVRCRFGSILSFGMEETRVVFHGRSRLGEEKAGECTVVRIQMESLWVWDTLELGRGVIAKNGQKIRVPAEILALHSPVFFTLFYGNFKETKEEWIRINCPNRYIMHLLVQACFRKEERTACMRFGLPIALSLARALDYFEMLQLQQQMQPGLAAAATRLTSADSKQFPLVPQLARFLRDGAIMAGFLDRFVTTECLDCFLRESRDALEWEDVENISAAMIKLSAKLYARTKIRFVFKEGEVVCALFGARSDHSDLITAIQQEGSEIFSMTRSLSRGCGTRLALRQPLVSIRKSDAVPPLFASKPTLLCYSSDAAKGKFRLILLPWEYVGGGSFFHRHPIGVALSGQSVAPTAKKLVSISVVQ